jgi:hypothetical protein
MKSEAPAPPPTGFASDRLYLPDNCEAIVWTNFDVIRDNPLYGKLHAIGKRAGFDIEKEQAELDSAFPAAEQCTSTVGIKSVSKKLVVAVVTTRDRVTPDSLKTLIQKHHPRKSLEFKERSVANRVLHESDGPSFCIVGERTVLTGYPGTIHGVLRRNQPPELPAGLRSALAEIDFTKASFAMALDVTLLAELASYDPASERRHNLMKKETGFKSAALQITVGKTIDAKAVLFFSNFDAAEQLRAAAQRSLDFLVDDVKATNDSSLAAQILDSVKVTRSGGKVLVTLHVNAEQADRILESIEKHLQEQEIAPRR